MEPERVLQRLHRERARQIALVVLDDDREGLERDLLFAEVFLEVLEALEVVREHRPLRVDDEHETVHAAQDDLAGLVVEDLSGNGAHLKANRVTLDVPELDGQEVEVDRPVLRRRERHELAGPALEALVEDLEVAGLSAETGSVIDDLGRQLLRSVVEQGHGSPPLSR
jgi:hypothetical protein